MTQEACGEACQLTIDGGPYPYFALGGGDTCYCGSDPLAYEPIQVSVEECDAVCNENEQCGGNNRLTLFEYDEVSSFM